MGRRTTTFHRARSTAKKHDDDPVEGIAQKTGFYFMAAIVLAVLGATLVAATQVDASGWLRGGENREGPRGHIAERVEFAVGWVLHRIDASEEQNQAVQEIVASSLEEFLDLHEANANAHERWIGILTADRVDPDALEAFRTDQMARLEIASRRFTEAIAAISAELTVDQREELAAFARKHRGRHRHAGFDD